MPKVYPSYSGLVFKTSGVPGVESVRCSPTAFLLSFLDSELDIVCVEFESAYSSVFMTRTVSSLRKVRKQLHAPVMFCRRDHRIYVFRKELFE